MKERPILFNSEMVRAILDGRKTQTRRLLKPQPDLVGNCWKWKNCAWTAEEPYCLVHNMLDPVSLCPFGQPGDRLWVRETWCVHPYALEGADKDEDMIVYRANDYRLVDSEFTWKPSIHMPRWASRITLEVVNVRVERLCSISHEDALKEGVWPGETPYNDELIDEFKTPAQKLFAGLWNSINGKRGYAWDTNPWVWVVEFKRVTP